ncbi:MAG: putative metal-dependent hydrolase [Bacteroidetes bacterium]|nr:putative metal-dependent hydrolase [Bacteroidota bacterium]
MEDLQYPIGKFIEQPFSEAQMKEWLLDIQSLPKQIEYAVINLDQHQLETPYRDGGWTIQQVVHHVADSHMNAYIRFKLGLTEETPVIKPYDEAAWAELSDTKNLPVNISITLLYAVHTRWVEIIKHIKTEEWNRRIFHPQHKKEMTLWYLLGLYAWHSRHHVAHITSLRRRKDW